MESTDLRAVGGTRVSSMTLGRSAALVAAALFFVSVVRLGWVSDDAFIAIRSVDHLVHGHGLVVNIGDRVQSFTSPLWTLLCIPFFAVTDNPFTSLAMPGVLASLTLAIVLVRGFRETPWKAAAILVLLSASTSFLHFSTSGLENPLAHALAALFVLERLKNGPGPTRACFVLSAALFLTRFDYAILTAPCIALALVTDWRRALRFAVPGAVLAGAWLTFAVVYYGFPLPNTAYAKLNTAISLGARVAQGISYLVDSACRDPVVLLGIATSGFVCLRRGALPGVRPLFVGVLGYVLYTVDVGGDFMSGRFLTTPYLVAVMVAAQVAASVHRLLLPLTTAAALVPATISGLSDRRADPRQTLCVTPESGIVDERECYIEWTGLAQNIRHQKWRRHPYIGDFQRADAAERTRTIVFDLVGLAAYANTTEKHIVERFALSEPLLAHIRFDARGGWRIGHFYRYLPPGYLESLRSGQNLVLDPCLHAMYDRLALTRSGPLWSVVRLKAIWELNTTHAVCPSG